MKTEIEKLKSQAEIAKDKYRLGYISREEAKQLIMPFINVVNSRQIELAKKYHLKPKKVNFIGFIR